MTLNSLSKRYFASNSYWVSTGPWKFIILSASGHCARETGDRNGWCN